MGRRRWNRKHPQKAEEQRQPRTEDVVDPPARLLALQPDSTVVAVAIGPRVTLVDYKCVAEDLVREGFGFGERGRAKRQHAGSRTPWHGHRPMHWGSAVRSAAVGRVRTSVYARASGI